MQTFNDAFQELVQDMYSAENQVLESMPKLSEAATFSQLSSGIDEHRVQTQEHVRRLEQVARMCNFNPDGKACDAAKGIIKEMDQARKEGDPGPVRDAMLISAAQKFEHYEIANYGTAVTWAKALGMPECAALLQQTLNEEVQTDKKLTQLAEGFINEQALSQSGSRATMR